MSSLIRVPLEENLFVNSVECRYGLIVTDSRPGLLNSLNCKYVYIIYFVSVCKSALESDFV